MAKHRRRAAFGNLGGIRAVRGADGRARGGEPDADRVEQVQPRGERGVFGERRLRGAAHRAHQLAGDRHALTMPASASRQPAESALASPRMIEVMALGISGKTVPAFSPSLERSVGSSNGLSAPPRALSTTADISAPSPKRSVTRAGRSFGHGLRSLY